jgi:glycosyltransferase involved in cell wall biosynthesis
MNKLSILICTIPSRFASYGRLITELRSQMLVYAPEIGIISNNSTELSIGAKRNWLLEKSESEYVCFIDDDDMIAPNYIELLMKAIESGCDCASLKGQITWDGKRPEIFEHSIKYNAYETVDGYIRYLRYPNHLNLIKSSIAKQFKFPEINHGEDTDFATQLHKSGLLKTEFYIDQIIYYYRYVTNKRNQVLAK